MSPLYTHSGSRLSPPAAHIACALRPRLVPVPMLLARSAQSRAEPRDSTVLPHCVLQPAPATTHAVPGPFVHSVLSSSPYGSPPSWLGLIVFTTRLPTVEVIPVYSPCVYRNCSPEPDPQLEQHKQGAAQGRHIRGQN